MDLRAFFNPSSIAIVGVSQDKRKVGYLVAANMVEQGYAGELYFINPKGGTVLGREMKTSIQEIGKPVDLAVLAIPASIALPYLDELHDMGVKNVVLFAAGFKETGDTDREQALVEKCSTYGMTLLGPNCIGYVNTSLRVNATFLKHIVPSGNIGFVSQSGALGSIMVDELVARHNLGLSYFISMGNKTVIDESDALEFLANDESTSVIAMYLEDVKGGEKFKKTLRDATLKKPVVILKSGTSEEGSKAALSHTGGLAGDDGIFSAVFKQCGAIRARDYIEFSTLLHMFSFDRVPTSRSVLVLSNAGGVGVLLADELVAENLSLVTVSPRTKADLAKVFGDSKKITVHNPIDLLGDASAFDYQKAITSTLQEKDIGSVVILLTPQANTEILETAKVIINAQAAFEKPIFPVFMGKDSVQQAHDLFEKNRVASFRYHDYLTHAIAKAVWYRNYLSEHAGHVDRFEHTTVGERNAGVIGTLLEKNHDKPYLNLEESIEVLKRMGIPVGELRHVRDESELKETARELGYPLTMKIASEDVTHKTEVKGVVTGIANLRQLEGAFEDMTTSPLVKSRGAYLQKQVKGYELFIGAKRDPNFGVVLVVGLGGIYAELFKEVSNRVFPFSQKDFIGMLKETRMYTLLHGFRGAPPVDFGMLYDVVCRVGTLMADYPSIKEIDMNPLFVSADAVVAVDARIIL
jgi:acetyltransferase